MSREELGDEKNYSNVKNSFMDERRVLPFSFSISSLKEKVTKESVFFLSPPIKVYIELSYSPKFQLLKCMLSRKISLQRRSIGSRHFEQVLNGQAAKRDVIQSKMSWQACLYSRSWLMFNLTVLSQNVFPMPEDSESENEEVNDRLEGTFWCSCERCETMPTQRECVCCREQPESEDKMEGIILSLHCIGRSQ